MPENKAVRVMHYQKNMIKEVGIIAHACGVRTPHQLQRFHVRVVTPNGISVPLNELYPDASANPVLCAQNSAGMKSEAMATNTAPDPQLMQDFETGS